MGEDPKYVFNTGSLDVELAAHVRTTITNEQINALGVGHDVDIEQPYLMVVQHPVTTEADNRAHLETTLKVVSSFELPTIWFWPNPDAGTGEMADSLRHTREQHPELTAHMRFITNVPANDFVALLAHAACLVGNSSAGIKECSFLGTPVVNIGNRQQGRLTGEHVTHVGYDATEIGAAIATQLAHGRYEPSRIYFKDNASETIVNLLAKTPLYTQKRFHDR
jgi:UDP-hydrolysing UDP-N-acetyl-D-glucosamine 2-epimerase